MWPTARWPRRLPSVGLVEDLADQPEVLVDDDGGAVGHRDPGRLLTAVLEGVQAEIGQLRDLLARRPDTEDATGVLRSGILGIEVVRQPSITARHGPRVPARTTIPRCRWGERGHCASCRPRRRSRPIVASCWTSPERRTPMPSDRPDPSEFLALAQRMLRELFGDARDRRRGALGGGDALGARVPRRAAERRAAAREPHVRARDARRRGARGPRAERRGDPPAARAHEPAARTGTTPTGAVTGSGDVRRLRGDRRVVAVPGADDGVAGQRQQPRADRRRGSSGGRCSERPVAPGPPQNSVSPVNTVPRSAA